MGRSIVRRVRHWVANRGWRGLFGEVLRRLKLKLHAGTNAVAGAPGRLPAAAIHPFDARYDVDTSGLIWGDSLNSGEKGEYWATGYYGISPSVLWEALDRLDLDWPSYAFLDIGCGKGRALMLALRYPFRQIVGIELSPELTRIANQNLAQFHPEWRTGATAVAIAGDATRFDLPDGPTLIYLYHPFAAPVMRHFLRLLAASLERDPRQVYLMYVNPELDHLFRESEFLDKVSQDFLSLAEEDVSADRFGSREECVSIYRSRPSR